LTIGNDKVLTVHILDSNVTLAKLADMATDSFIGRTTAATGIPEILSKAQALTILNVEDGADVTDVTNVTAAGALMDSEVASLAAIKDVILTSGLTISANWETGDETKLSGIEALADVTDETNVLAALDGATLTAVTPAVGDKFLYQDITDSDNIKTATGAQIAGLLTYTQLNALVAAPDANMIFNESGGDYDLRAESDGNNSKLLLDAGINRLQTAAGEAATALADIGGILEQDVVASATTGTSEEPLMTYSLPADSLTQESDGVRITVWGQTAANANNKTLKIKFGS
jgi:hypothetical protein